MDELTKRQQQVLDFIQECIYQRGYGPTIREICGEFGFASPNGAMAHIRALERKNRIHRTANSSRSIELTDESKELIEGLPFVGVVSAGAMLEAFEQRERIDLGSKYPSRNHFVLQISGDSMIDAHIQDGDYIIVKNRRTADAGDIVVARTSDGESTVKYWFPEKKRIRLQPANKRLKPIYTKDAKVTGVVVGVVRQL